MKIPYVRLWFNLFSLKKGISKKDYLIDTFLLIFTFVGVYAILCFFVKIDYRIYYDLLIVYYYLLFIPLFIKRLITVKRLILLFTLLCVGPFVIFPIFCGALEEKNVNDDFGLISKNNKKGLIFVVIFFVVIFAFIVKWLVVICTLSYARYMLNSDGYTITFKNNINEYDDCLKLCHNAEYMMPKISDLNDYKDIKFSYLERNNFGDQEGYSLFVTYGDNYHSKKEEMLSSYEFYDKSITDGTHQYLPVTSFIYDGYYYQIVMDYAYFDQESCNSFSLIGYNDEKMEIAYHYYYGVDTIIVYDKTDDLEDAMIKFVSTVFYYYD